MALATRLGFLGIAKETTAGVAVAPTGWIPVPVTRTWHDSLIQLDDLGYRGNARAGPWDQYAGPLYSTYQIPDGPGYADSSLPWWLCGILGDVTSLASRSVADAVTNSTTTITSATAAFTQNDVGRPVSGSAAIPAGSYIVTVSNATTILINVACTSSLSGQALTVGAAALVSHVASVKNPGAAQPTTFTLTDFYSYGGTHSRQFPGCRVTSVTVRFSGLGLLTVAASLTGFPSTLVTQPSAGFTTVPATPGWEAQVSIGGSPIVRLVSAELTFSRPTPGPTAGALFTIDGTQGPAKVRVGGLDVVGRAVFVAVDDTEYLTYLNNTKPAVIFDFRHGTPGTGFLGSKFQLSRCNHTQVRANHGGGYMVWDADLRGLWNATDVGATGGSSPVKVTFQNAASVGTYQ